MNFNTPILFFFCALGVFNGFLLSLYFIFFHKVKRVQNLFLGILLLVLSTRIGKSVYTIFTPREDRDLVILQIGLSACFLIGVSLFFYIKTSIENKKVFPKTGKLHYAVLIAIILIVGLLKPYKTQRAFWANYFVQFIYGVWGIYVLAAGYLLKDIFSKLIKREGTTTSEIWLIAVFLANLLIYIAYIIGYFYLYLIGTLTFSFVFYGLLIFLLFKKNRETIFKDIPEKYKAKKIDKTEVDKLISDLNKLMQEEKLYKNSTLKLKDVAKELHIIPHKLSQLVNENLGKSFAQFISEYRVEEAKNIIKQNTQYTLESIGYEAGFSSKSSFYATFKKNTGMTPSEYKNQE